MVGSCSETWGQGNDALSHARRYVDPREKEMDGEHHRLPLFS